MLERIVHENHEHVYTQEDGNKSVYNVARYKCHGCGKTYLSIFKDQLDEEIKGEINLDEKIKNIHANTGLSFEKIAEIIRITMNISISHTYIQNLIEQPVDEFEYRDEFVILPQDFKVNKKTSNDRKVTDTAIVHMFKRMDVKISGKLTADEVFLKMMKNRQ